MRIASIRIRNFRGLKKVDIPLAQTTVLIGENNSGKSSVLDSISLALGRRWGQRGTGFSEYDLTIDADPAMANGSQTIDTDRSALPDRGADEDPTNASIELLFTEQTPRDWPDAVSTGLFDIVQTDPLTGLNSITLRVTYTLDQSEKTYEPGWSFIDINGDPLATAAAKRASTTRQFFKYVPVFFLSALRDASIEFSPRSQFWGRLLRAVEISPTERQTLNEAIEDLNARLLAADPRVAETVERLKEIQEVVAHGAAADVSIRALPMRVWELLARSEIVIQGESGAPWLPLRRQGQGVKSLAVIYLFNAYVERLLKATYSEHSEPIVALEEPEVHLHPQAVRALWSQIDAMPGQKVIASHSPYFIQYTPIRDIRLLRRGPDGVQVHFVPDAISLDLPANDALMALVCKHSGQLSYDQGRGMLSTNKPVSRDLYRDILRCFTEDKDREYHPSIRNFRAQSHNILEEKDRENLEDWARRIRGEVFFSRFWILCEGPSEIYLLTALFDALEYRLDVHGVSLIDYQNNGSARAFACLARVFRFPWVLLADGDEHGRNTITSLENAGFGNEDIRARSIRFPDGVDLEDYVVSSTWRHHALAVAKQFDEGISEHIGNAELAETLRSKKPHWARRLGDRLRQSPPSVSELPIALAKLRTVLLEHDPDYDTAHRN